MKLYLSKAKQVKNTDDMNDLLSKWIGPDIPEESSRQTDTKERSGEPAAVVNTPIEPEKRRMSGLSILKWFLFLLFIGYGILSYYRVPLLTALGSYLMLEHPVEKADLIVCTPETSLGQGLTAADLYNRGLAPRIFIPRESPPEGLDVLEAHGGQYPTPSELARRVLESLDIPGSACVMGRRPVNTVSQEARELKEWIVSSEVHSMIIITAPWKARRTYRVFKDVMDEDTVTIRVFPGRYSGFTADSWWKSDRYTGHVVMEYQRLAYDTLKGMW